MLPDYLGGTLWLDLPSQHPSDIVHKQGKPYATPMHQVTLKGGLRMLLGKETLEVNTLHHQAVRDLGSDFLTLTAFFSLSCNPL